MKKKVNEIAKRDVGPVFRFLRDRMLGRKTVYGLRFEQDISDRTLPAPALPDGPNSKLFGNHYYERDARRMIDRPLLIADSCEKIVKLPLQESDAKHLMTGTIGVLPGRIYDPHIEAKMPIRDPAKLEQLQQQKQQKK